MSDGQRSGVLVLCPRCVADDVRQDTRPLASNSSAVLPASRDIMTFDALRKEAQIVFGALPDNNTCDFEPDESVFFLVKDVVWTEDTKTGSWKQ